MPRGTLFWVLEILAVLFGGFGFSVDRTAWRPWGGYLLILILIALLGWTVYGAAVR
jgi:hypothetical protein